MGRGAGRGLLALRQRHWEFVLGRRFYNDLGLCFAAETASDDFQNSRDCCLNRLIHSRVVEQFLLLNYFDKASRDAENVSLLIADFYQADYLNPSGKYVETVIPFTRLNSFTLRRLTSC